MHGAATAAPLQNPTPQHPPLQAWRAHEADPYRACTLCDHGPARTSHAGLCALGGQPRLRVNAARAHDGPCGPEARHMRIDGWDLQT